MKATENTLMTKSQFNSLPSQAYTEVREAYYRASDSIYGLKDVVPHLGEHERKAINQIAAAFEALSHLGKHL